MLQLVGDPRWRLNISPALVFEYEEVLKREAEHLWLNPAKAAQVLDFICAVAGRPRIFYSWRPFLPDSDDDMILELAVAARADFIVTHNRADFRGAEQFGLGILSPREFLRKLGEAI